MRIKAFITGLLIYALCMGIEGHMKSVRLCHKILNLAYAEVYFKNIQVQPEITITLARCMGEN